MIDSCFSLAEDPSQIEFLVKLDSDDLVSLQMLEEIQKQRVVNVRWIVTERGKGYLGIKDWYAQLASISQAEWFLLFDDDARMATPGWDTILNEYSHHWDNEGGILMMLTRKPPLWSPDLSFINRKVFDVLGHFSETPYADTYVFSMLQVLDRVRMIPIDCIHFSGKLLDQVTKDRKDLEAKDFDLSLKLNRNPTLVRKLLADAEKMLCYLESH